MEIRPRIRAVARGASVALVLAAMAGCVGRLGARNTPPSPSGSDGGSVVGVAFAPAAPAMRRLTTTEYTNSVRDVFGTQVQLTTPLEADEVTARFSSIGASTVSTSNEGVQQYRDAAMDLAAQVLAHRSSYPTLAGCTPHAASDPCVAAVLREFGRRLWRRALTSDEVTRYAGVVGAGGSDADALTLGLRYAIAGLLQSPNFLYVVAAGEPFGSAGARRYTSVEMASRLSYFVWDSAPDEALLDAGESGALATTDGVASQLTRMLAQPRAQGLATRFFSESWNVGRMTANDKNAMIFPQWNADLLGAFQREFTLTIEDLVTRDADLHGLFNARTTFANPALAAFYGAPAPTGGDFARVALPDTRAGLLTSGAVLAANSPSNRTSPTRRGVFVLEQVLCRQVPPPPANVNTGAIDSAETTAGLTVRQRLEMHRSMQPCASCHQLFDPMGVTFENFDAIGTYRTQDDGEDVDASGTFDGTPISNARGLADQLGQGDEAMRCIAQRLYEYAAGHEVDLGEQPSVDAMARAFAADGYRFKRLVTDVVTSDAFRLLTPGAP